MQNPKQLDFDASSPSSNNVPVSRRKMFALLFKSILCLWALPLPAMQIELTLDQLIPALIQVESNGDDHAINYREEAVGCLQITRAVVADFNARHKNERYEHHEMFERAKAVRVARWYLTYWGTRNESYPNPTPEKLARIWNGGPSGHQKPATEKYWQKVKLYFPTKYTFTQ